MTNWLTSSNRKKYQRRINKIVRHMNENIAADDLWRGRFYCKQGSYCYWHGSNYDGWGLYVILELHDKFTGRVMKFGEDVNSICMWNGSKLFWQMNHFIVEECSTWEQNPRPGTQEYKEMTDKYVKEGWPHE